MTIDEKLKLVAEKDGWEKFTTISGDIVDGLYCGHWVHNFMHVRDMKYHSSWDWQIPVWVKLYKQHQDSGGELIYSEEKRLFMIEVLDGQPEAAFELLVKIIQRINS